MAAIEERIRRAIATREGRDLGTFEEVRDELFKEIMTAAVTRHALPGWLAAAVSNATWQQWHLLTVEDQCGDYFEIPMATYGPRVSGGVS